MQAHADEQHFCAHSHHYWPDISREAGLEAWDDSCRLLDHKWDRRYQVVYPELQRLVADTLKVSNSNRICFASNTHELVFRLMSCFHSSRVKVLTSDSEFYSFDRQADRMAEVNQIEIKKVNVFPNETFLQRFEQEIKSGEHNFIYLSHVFFNSGFRLDLKKLFSIVKNFSGTVVIDAYHSWCAIPFDWSLAPANCFLTAGGYKYAAAGEGCCFLVMPENFNLNPVQTGWYPKFFSDEGKDKKVSFPKDSFRFAGSTLDWTAFYRLRSVLNLFKEKKISIEDIHQHALIQQKYFLKQLKLTGELSKENLVVKNLDQMGHFFCFDLQSEAKRIEVEKRLLDKKMITDGRGSILRFGLGLYHNCDFSLENLYTDDFSVAI